MANAEKPKKSKHLKLEIMKTFNLKSLVVATLVIFSVACKKDQSGTTINQATNAKEFVAAFGPKKQFTQVNASALPQTVTLNGGTEITFPAGSLRIDGTPVTGNVTVEAIEVLKRSDVLFSGTNTNHISGAPLASDGFIFVDVRSNGISVDRNLAVPMKVKIPAKRAGITQLWEGVNPMGQPLAEGAANQMAWQAPKQANGGVRESAPVAGFYNFDFGTTGWINCDVFYSYANPKTTITVDVLNNPGTLASFHAYSGETYIFFCAKGSNVAAQLYTPNGPNSVKSYDNMMPVGVEGKLLSFSIKDGKYYYAESEITISANQNIVLSLAETTEANVQAAITSLNTY